MNSVIRRQTSFSSKNGYSTMIVLDTLT